MQFSFPGAIACPQILPEALNRLLEYFQAPMVVCVADHVTSVGRRRGKSSFSIPLFLNLA